MAKMKKLKVIKDPKPRKKKNSKGEIELTDTCDQCGKSLGRTCARTVNSSVCAMAESIVSVRSDKGIFFFCDNICLNDFWGKMRENF